MVADEQEEEERGECRREVTDEQLIGVVECHHIHRMVSLCLSLQVDGALTLYTRQDVMHVLWLQASVDRRSYTGGTHGRRMIYSAASSIVEM